MRIAAGPEERVTLEGTYGESSVKMALFCRISFPP
jgi:hypothetical protein